MYDVDKSYNVDKSQYLNTIVNTARFLNHVWSFFNIMHERDNHLKLPENKCSKSTIRTENSWDQIIRTGPKAYLGRYQISMSFLRK